ncbi:hypothetical protein MARI_33920 (plasmid) [Marinobacter sp. JH2]|nr:plasmid replication initiator TrfA [Marinobacter sp. JH2]QBM19246.1 hypothetical protein MARI_33920 [Marinobacter sp. JH2]
MAAENPTNPYRLTSSQLSIQARPGETDREAKVRQGKECHTEQNKNQRQAERVANAPKMPIWPVGMSALPNAMVRSSIFTVANRNTERKYLSGVNLPVAGPGQIKFRGQELRQDDKQLLLHIIDLVRETHGRKPLIDGTDFEVSTTVNKLVTSMGWRRSGRIAVRKNGQPTGKYTGGTMARFFDALDRLQTSQIVIFTSESDAIADPNRDGVVIVPRYSYTPRQLTIRMPAEFFQMLAKGFTLVNLDVHKKLPSALARWLHTYVLTHKKETPIALNTLIKFAGMTTPKTAGDRATRRTSIRNALDALKKHHVLSEDSELKDDVLIYRRHRHATLAPAKIEAGQIRAVQVADAKDTVDATARELFSKGAEEIANDEDGDRIDLLELATAWREIVNDALKAIEHQDTPNALPLVKALERAWTGLAANAERHDASARQAQPPAAPQRE